MLLLNFFNNKLIQKDSFLKYNSNWRLNHEYMSIFSVPNPESKESFIVKESLQFLIRLTDDFHIENRSNLVKLIYY